MAASDRDLISKFIANERRAKVTTLVSVAGFLILAFFIIFLMVKLKEAKAATDKEKIKTNLALFKADSLLFALEAEKAGAANRNNQVLELPSYITQTDDTWRKTDDNSPQEVQISAAPSPIYPPENEQGDISGNSVVKSKIVIRKPAALESTVFTRKNNVTVYIQYKKNYLATVKKLDIILEQENFKVPGRELVDKLNFSTSVKYFNDEDKHWAEMVAKQVNSLLEGQGKSEVRIVKNDLKAPSGQLEVWLGDYERPNNSVLLNRYQSKQ